MLWCHTIHLQKQTSLTGTKRYPSKGGKYGAMNYSYFQCVQYIIIKRLLFEQRWTHHGALPQGEKSKTKVNNCGTRQHVSFPRTEWRQNEFTSRRRHNKATSVSDIEGEVLSSLMKYWLRLSRRWDINLTFSSRISEMPRPFSSDITLSCRREKVRLHTCHNP